MEGYLFAWFFYRWPTGMGEEWNEKQKKKQQQCWDLNILTPHSVAGRRCRYLFLLFCFFEFSLCIGMWPKFQLPINERSFFSYCCCSLLCFPLLPTAQCVFVNFFNGFRIDLDVWESVCACVCLFVVFTGTNTIYIIVIPSFTFGRLLLLLLLWNHIAWESSY